MIYTICEYISKINLVLGRKAGGGWIWIQKNPQTLSQQLWVPDKKQLTEQYSHSHRGCSINSFPVCSEATVLTKAALSAKMQLAFCFHCTLSKQQKKKDTFCNNKDLTSKREKREREREHHKKSGCLSKLTHHPAEDRKIALVLSLEHLESGKR